MINSYSFCISRLIISSLLLGDIFASYRIVGWQLFLSIHSRCCSNTKHILHSHSVISNVKPASVHICLSVWLSLYYQFGAIWLWCTFVDFIWCFLCLAFIDIPDRCASGFCNVWTLSAGISSNIFLRSTLSHLLWRLWWHRVDMTPLEGFPQLTHALFILKNILFLCFYYCL